MLDDNFKKSAMEKVTTMSANELKKAFKEIGSEPETNEEWFCQLPTEEKAQWLDGLIAYCFGVGHRTETEQKKYQHIVADVEVWLKQPHRGGEK